MKTHLQIGVRVFLFMGISRSRCGCRPMCAFVGLSAECDQTLFLVAT